MAASQDRRLINERIDAAPKPRSVLDDLEVGASGQRVKGSIAGLKQIRYLHPGVHREQANGVANVCGGSVVPVTEFSGEDEDFLHEPNKVQGSGDGKASDF
jgi:hypothetical protein